MPHTITAPRLHDHSEERDIVLDYPGVSNADMLAFCSFFKVKFHSLRTFTPPPPGLSANDLFRVSTQDYPARGLDLTFRSVVSWKKAEQTRYRDPVPGDTVDLRKVGRVRVLCVAQGLDEDEDDIVAFEQEDGRVTYIARERFVGVSYDKATDAYLPNAVKVAVKVNA